MCTSYMSCQSVHFDLHERHIVSRVNVAFEVSKSFLVKSFFCIPGGISLFSLPLSPFLNMFADLTNLSLSLLSVNCRNACVTGLAGHSICLWSRRHSYRNYCFFQHVLNFLFCRVVVKPCHFSSPLVLILLSHRSLSSRFYQSKDAVFYQTIAAFTSPATASRHLHCTLKTKFGLTTKASTIFRERESTPKMQ